MALGRHGSAIGVLRVRRAWRGAPYIPIWDMPRGDIAFPALRCAIATKRRRAFRARMVSAYSSRYERFLERLRAARLDAALTQQEVAKQLRQHQSFVSKCETGERRVDAVEFAEFARLYGKPLNWFVE